MFAVTKLLTAIRSSLHVADNRIRRLCGRGHKLYLMVEKQLIIFRHLHAYALLGVMQKAPSKFQSQACKATMLTLQLILIHAHLFLNSRIADYLLTLKFYRARNRELAYSATLESKVIFTCQVYTTHFFASFCVAKWLLRFKG